MTPNALETFHVDRYINEAFRAGRTVTRATRHRARGQSRPSAQGFEGSRNKISNTSSQRLSVQASLPRVHRISEERCRLEVEPHRMSPNRGCASQQPTHSSVASLAAPGRPATHPTTQPVTGRETGPEPSPLGVNPEDLSSGGRAHLRTRFLTDGVFALVFEVACGVLCEFLRKVVTSYQCTTKIIIEGLNARDCACAKEMKMKDTRVLFAHTNFGRGRPPMARDARARASHVVRRTRGCDVMPRAR